jgi:hypothetical protein
VGTYKYSAEFRADAVALARSSGRPVSRIAAELVSRFEFVADHRGAFGVKRLRTVLNVSRSGFYRWLKTAPARAAKQASDAALTRRIRKVHAESGRTYGGKRITAGLRAGGVVVNRERVERLTRQHAIETKVEAPPGTDTSTDDPSQRDQPEDHPTRSVNVTAPARVLLFGAGHHCAGPGDRLTSAVGVPFRSGG